MRFDVPIGVLIADPIISIVAAIFGVVAAVRLLGVDPGRRRLVAAGLTDGVLIAVWTLINHAIETSMEAHVLVGMLFGVLSIWLVGRVWIGVAIGATLIIYLLTFVGSFVLMGLLTWIHLEAAVILANPLLYLAAGTLENILPIAMGLLLWRRRFALVDFSEPLPTSGKTLWLLNIFLAQTFGLTFLGGLSLWKSLPVGEVFPIGLPGVLVWTIIAGMPIASIMVLREINRLYQAEVRLRQKEGLELVGRIATAVAHDVRNPITTIKGYARLIQRMMSNVPIPHAPVLKEAVAGISHEVTYVDDFVDDLRLLGEPEEGTAGPVDFGALLREVMGGEERLAPQGVRVSLHMAGPLPRVYSYPARLRRILATLVSNAVENCGEDGTVRVGASYSPDRQRITITVADNGQGIPPEHLARIFDPFFDTNEGKSGLGLFTIKKMVDDCGGSIEVRSEACRGTEFAVHFPVPVS